MTHSPHLLGYSKLGVECTTRGVSDQRERFDFATPLECEWQPDQPEHLRLRGPSQVGQVIARLAIESRHARNVSRLLVGISRLFMSSLVKDLYTTSLLSSVTYLRLCYHLY